MALAQACTSFDASPAEDTLPDAAPSGVDGAVDDAGDSTPPACGKPTISVRETFESTTFPPLLWQKGANTGGTVARVTDVAHSPPASFQAEGTADAKGIEAQIEHSVDVEPASIDLRYAVSLIIAPGAYAEVGCTIRLSRVPYGGDVTRIALAVEQDGRLVARPRGVLGPTEFGDRRFIFSSVEPGWYDVHEVATVTSSGVDVTMTVVAPSGVSNVVKYTTKKPSALNWVGVHCGIDTAVVAADAASVPVTAHVDDIALDICPR